MRFERRQMHWQPCQWGLNERWRKSGRRGGTHHLLRLAAATQEAEHKLRVPIGLLGVLDRVVDPLRNRGEVIGPKAVDRGPRPAGRPVGEVRPPRQGSRLHQRLWAGWRRRRAGMAAAAAGEVRQRGVGGAAGAAEHGNCERSTDAGTGRCWWRAQGADLLDRCGAQTAAAVGVRGR